MRYLHLPLPARIFFLLHSPTHTNTNTQIQNVVVGRLKLKGDALKEVNGDGSKVKRRRKRVSSEISGDDHVEQQILTAADFEEQELKEKEEFKRQKTDAELRFEQARKKKVIVITARIHLVLSLSFFFCLMSRNEKRPRSLPQKAIVKRFKSSTRQSASSASTTIFQRSRTLIGVFFFVFLFLTCMAHIGGTWMSLYKRWGG